MKLLISSLIFALALFNSVANAGELRVAMNNVAALTDDEYICETYQLNGTSVYVNNFRPDLNKNVVHHVLIYGCKAGKPGTRRNCFSPCEWYPDGQGSRIIYAWANEAPELNLPEDVSFNLGGETGWKYVVIQVHFKDKFKDPTALDSSGIVLSYQNERTKYTAGIYLFAASLFRIQPKQTDVREVLKCTMALQQPIYVFAVRVHAHTMGKAIGVFAYNNSEWVRVVERSPQRPQAFYPLPAPVRFSNGLDVAARCVFDSSETDHAVGIGSSRADEMCNAYLMFYTEDPDYSFDQCDAPSPILPLPEPDSKEMTFKGEGHMHMGGHDHGGMPMASPSTDEHHQHDMTGMQPGGAHVHEEERKIAAQESLSWKFEIHRDDAWTQAVGSERFPMLGQVGGVAKDGLGNMFVFHRGSRSWNAFSFDGTYKFAHKTEGPITENTVVMIAQNGTVLDSWGAGLFYMPHGITVCTKTNSLWLTDVAQHQVFRYDLDAILNRADKSKFDVKPTLVFGVEFEPGKDEGHLCQPAGVAVLADGSAVIADGYCNTRLLVVSQSGKVARSVPLIDGGIPALVVHAVTYVPSVSLIYAADRENGRIFVVSATNFSISHVITPSSVPTRIFGVATYQPPACQDSVVIAFNQSVAEIGRPAAFFFLSTTENKVLDTVPLATKSDLSHAMVVDSVNSWIYVGQIMQEWSPEGLLRFHTSLLGSCASTAASTEDAGLLASFSHAKILNWITQSVQSPSSFIGLLVFILSICVVIIITVLVCRLCRRRTPATSRRSPRGAGGRDYDAQYSLLVGDAAVKRVGGKKNGGFEGLDSDDEEDDIVDQRRLVSRPPGGGAKSRFVGFPPENGNPSRKAGDGDKIV